MAIFIVPITADELPPRWEAAVNKMIKDILADPHEDVYQLMREEALFIKPTLDTLLVNLTEDQKALFVEDLMQGMTKAFKKKSRIPLKHRMSNAVIGCVVDHLGKVPPKKMLTPELAEHAKQFADQLITICRDDWQCRRYL